MVTSQTGSCCVVDRKGVLEGVVSMHSLMEVIRRLEVEARRHYKDAEASS